ncbi:UDP-glucose 4-epimerase GalE (plasmid) [Rhodobacteraceae bacterium M382]|nr:UDP-glucose 4-epimerase GalE [Rhodobacteraceae bacterium M382]
MSKHVLVTGGAGYIGSHTCKVLKQKGYIPVCYDNLSRGNRHAVKYGPFEEGDIADAARIREVVETYRPIAAIHFAAFAYVGESMDHPDIYYRNNTSGTVALLDALRANGVERIVFSSTCATYGTPETVPISETLPQNPINPYGRSKLFIEHVLRDYAAAYGMSAVALRYFNAAGCDPDGEIGEEHDPETHLIPLMLEAARTQDPDRKLTVFGDDHPTPDGTCIRDYIHVMDLAAAHVQALDLMEAEPGFHVLNLGTGQGLSILELIQATKRITNREVPYVMGPRRAGDPSELVADPSLARQKLGWTPEMSDMDTLLRTAWTWLTRNDG